MKKFGWLFNDLETYASCTYLGGVANITKIQTNSWHWIVWENGRDLKIKWSGNQKLKCLAINEAEKKINEIQLQNSSNQNFDYLETKIPARLEIDVLPADEPKNLKLGWIVNEKIGTAVTNFNKSDERQDINIVSNPTEY